jgi:hypothetical protein
MFRSVTVSVSILLFCAAAAADDSASAGKEQQPQQQKAQGNTDVKMSGMSVLGNEEAPKSLVIVPWKSSQLGDAPGLSKLLDDSTQPVDKEVFMRELAYYQIKTTSN